MQSTHLPIVWTIAASDSSGGAGIQADIKTFFDLGVHGCNAITAITAQNTQGVVELQATSDKLLVAQLQALVEDLPPVAIKIGVLPSVDIVLALVNFLQKNPQKFVVFDPVLAPTLGGSFTNQDTVVAIKQLLPLIDLLTPNIPEAEQLTGLTISDTDSQVLAAEQLMAMGASAVLLKGGHGNSDNCQDFFLSKQQSFWLTQRTQPAQHSHGTGCVLSAAIVAFLAQEKPLRDAVVLANAYISKGLRLARPLDRAVSKRGAVAQTGWPDNLNDFAQISEKPKSIDLVAMPVCDTSRLGLYPVVDSIEWLKKLLSIGVSTIQLRIKDVPADELESNIQQAAALGRHYKARLFINDYWQLAIKYNAYGVHLGQEDMVNADVDAIRRAGLRLGISTHGEYEFSYAATFKPSYLAIGAIFPTDTKEVIEVGLDNLNCWAKVLNNDYPLVAIGGINQRNIGSVLASGVGSIAVVSAITKSNHYILAVEKFNTIISQHLLG
ncbi:MAG: hydroxymethylpyrimidine kinase/phosphomethylpyrimidine kinase/thiamine-phosphate diphosphorylase [Candidatus Endobugula sp.]|jgi:hydroxymethylpyrimidine kinase/phosphomethylpyrimidine kinase/thiamine-phosphate diphosphorylase